MQELVLLIESQGHSFLFDGLQNTQLRMHPFEHMTIDFTAVGTSPGFHPLPTINVTSTRWNKPLLHPHDNYELFISPS